MKKFIKIFSLVIFIILVLGITTSKVSALTVTSSTTATQMLNALRSGDTLTGISSTVREENVYLLCRQKKIWQYTGAKYTFLNSQVEEYPGTSENGYAKAYILAATENTNYTSDEIQDAWWEILGQKDPDSDSNLYTLAIAYQNYRKGTETEISLTGDDDAVTTVSGENVVYGPLQLKYSYASASSGNKKDEWGGVSYAFFDEDGNNISSKIKLCILKNGTYTEITSTKDSSTGYYKVSTQDYNGKNLYVVTTDKTIAKVTIDIKSNLVEYEAQLYSLTGEYELTEEGINLCSDCAAKINGKEKVIYNGAYYIRNEAGDYSHTTWLPVGSGWMTNFNRYGTTNVATGEADYTGYEYVYYYADGGMKNSSYVSLCGDIGAHQNIKGDYVCNACNGLSNSTNEHECSKIVYTMIRYYTVHYYTYTKFEPCGKSIGPSDKGLYFTCGSYYSAGTISSQGLNLINSTSKTTIADASIDLDIELAATIEVTKKWSDFNNFNNVRPSSITLNVYRSTDGTNWTLLTKGTDYTETWTDNKNNTWTGEINGLQRADSKGNIYYFKVEEANSNYYIISYETTNIIDKNTSEKKLTITNTLKYVNIPITKTWDDYTDIYGLRPSAITLNVYRSTDNATWTKLTAGKDYIISWSNKTGETWTATISQLLGVDARGNEYYFKVEEQALEYYDASYQAGQVIQYEVGKTTSNQITIKNSLKKINIGGYVWLDGQTGIKPAVTSNGIMDAEEEKLANIVVYLYYKDPTTGKTSKIAETITDENGYYEFNDYEIGYYYVEFEYDGINYEDTISVTNGSSKAFEIDTDRDTFNSKFKTITYKKSNDGTVLDYAYSNRESTLITNEENSTKIKSEFIMNATTTQTLYLKDVNNLNLGLVKRGIDIALSTDVYDAEVSINGQTTDYTYNKEDNSIEIGTTQTNEEVSYNLNLYASDYNYRVRDYVNTQDFNEKDYINDSNSGIKTGDDLEIYVTYELNLQNQSTVTTKINEVKYTYDDKYSFVGVTGGTYDVDDTNNVLTINLNGTALGDGETKTIYLEFKVKEVDNAVNTGEFTNKAEITSYSTDEGLIDTDSQPGNFVEDGQVEDDCDTAAGITISVVENNSRIITGKVFDDDESKNVDGVIVQLIELKTVNGKIYEYIWQETVSGSGTGLRLNSDGSALEGYTYSVATGYYEFKGFIPGDYIVRFIYGDGTTYDMTDDVIKYNGQDYKSITDSNYNAEWYNSSSYTSGASVARDNEARRLETMAYSVEIDAEKGVLLKLLNNLSANELNETEKETIVAIYNNLYDPDLSSTENVTDDVIDKLLKEEILANTWMCAETSKIKVPVDTSNSSNTNSGTVVDGTNQSSYVTTLSNINLGIELRPATKIELEKYITSFKLVASNGQTLVNAYVDVNEYLNGETDISNKVQGIRDNVTILNTVWQYEISPTEINTIVDGATLEFEYTLVVKNTGDTDYLSAELAEAYNNNSIDDYKDILKTKSDEIKEYMRNGTYIYKIGNAVGSSYYLGGTGSSKVLTEITNIRDYVNNDLTFITSGGDVAVDEDAPHTYRILRDDYSLQTATINTVLKTTETTGKMENDGVAVLYTVTLGKNPISSTGNLNFENYIAEVMSYTNAAGRRAVTSTPANAEIVDHEYRDGKEHEMDEADTGRIQIGAATGDEQTTNYIIIIAVIAGITIVAIGAYVVKKFIIK